MMFGGFILFTKHKDPVCTLLLDNTKVMASGSPGIYVAKFLRMHHWLPNTAVFKKMYVFKSSAYFGSDRLW